MQFNVFKHLRILPGIRGLSSPSNSGQGYTPRGPQTNTIKGSGKPGGGTPVQPSGNGTGGQTNTSTGSTKPGGRAA